MWGVFEKTIKECMAEECKVTFIECMKRDIWCNDTGGWVKKNTYLEVISAKTNEQKLELDANV